LAKALQTAAGNAGGDFYPYTIDNSARFDSIASPLTRTPSGGNNKTFSISMWVKITDNNSNSSSGTGSMWQTIGSSVDTTLRMNDHTNGAYPSVIWPYAYTTSVGSYIGQDRTASLYRDVSSWYHILWVVDTTNATEADRCIVYVNGVRQSLTQMNAWLYDTNTGVWTDTNYLLRYFGGYAADVIALDGTAASATDFGEDKNGVWVPKDPSGLTFGTNGFWLDFADSSNLGNDVSGNNNDFTSSGLTSSDQTIDTPTNNFATLNPLLVTASAANTYSNGSLDATTGTTGGGNVTSTMAVPSSGKWYFEVTVTAVGSGTNIGLWEPDASEDFGYQVTPSIAYLSSAYKRVNNSTTSYGATYTTNDVIGVAVDIDASTVTYYKNNTSQGSISFDASGLFPFMCDNTGGSGASVSFDFGQLGFTYTPPTDALALCTANLPEPTISPNTSENSTGTTSSEHFDIALWTGNGTAIGSGGNTISSLEFQPDFVWIKRRDATGAHNAYDAIRGATKELHIEDYDVESTQSEGLTSFTSTGFTLGSRASSNASGSPFVSWNWKGANSTSSNTNGSITSTVSANTDAGFSIVTYTGNATAGATVGHGLNSAPEFIVVKSRAITSGWPVMDQYANSGNGQNGWYLLDATDYWSSTSALWNNTSPTSSVFTLG
ncbi:MAG: SPRY domain-containing protein, partial [Candidatus Poseidoniales archaeon]